jgi:hypothetical protein
MMNRLDGLVEYYQARTLMIQFLTQRGTHTIGHRLSSQIRDRIHKRFDSVSSGFVSRDCLLTVRLQARLVILWLSL